MSPKVGRNGVSQCLKHLVPIHFKTCSETCLTHASTIPQIETCTTVKRVSSAKTGMAYVFMEIMFQLETDIYIKNIKTCLKHVLKSGTTWCFKMKCETCPQLLECMSCDVKNVIFIKLEQLVCYTQDPK